MFTLKMCTVPDWNGISFIENIAEFFIVTYVGTRDLIIPGGHHLGK